MDYNRKNIEKIGIVINEIMYQKPKDVYIIKHPHITVLAFHTNKAVDVLNNQPQKVLDYIYITDNVPKLEFDYKFDNNDAIDLVMNRFGLTYGLIDVSNN